ncbi:Uma2 family endonuclease [Microcystis aeruginosa CS-338/01]|uniref:Uma2 family endonuclease n=1 Tax=Microcystis aeruginosa TaxID=1126 RepID=UPI00232C465C|nr:Uma2 family endonuclease [Microcystis aeruginosa]MDB9508344.1 Uma2 family endonuclease [Microcystis aeruginosa CS-338/01]
MSLSLITRKFTVEEYEKMANEGIIKPDEKVELIRGEIIKMSPMGTHHAASIYRLTQLFYRKFGDLILLGVQNPIRLNNNSQPEPDLSLLIPRSDFYVAAYPCPQDIYLIIEVSDSTLDYDRYTKIPLYAEANIKEVWIVNLKEECLEVYRYPLQGSYQDMQKYYRGESIFIESFPEIELTFTEILGNIY